ncbi:MAG: PaaX family transcriptional regulator C-terminal domain-containing protein [Acidimicrobiales bacterium]
MAANLPELSTPTRAFISGLADEAGHLEAEPLFIAADAAGFSTTKLRLAIKRMIDGGLLTSTGRGRKAKLQLTEAGLAARTPDLIWAAAAYRADAGLDPWDGIWHLAAFEIPENQRTARDALRNQIRDLYGAPLTSGLYLSPLPWEPWLHTVAAAHDVSDRLTTIETTVLHHGGITDPEGLAAAVWPVADIHADYEAFISRWEPILAAIPPTPATAVRAAFEANADFEAVFRRDPLLPADLVPDTFAGPAARVLFMGLTDAFGQHEILAEASLFGAYRSAIAAALDANQQDFWARALRATKNR